MGLQINYLGSHKNLLHGELVPLHGFGSRPPPELEALTSQSAKAPITAPARPLPAVIHAVAFTPRP